MSHHGIITELKSWLSQQIIGQERLLDRLLIALLADGHLLVEGAPGLAKTKAIKDLSRAVEGDFHRIQFTPDLLPSDITGTEVFRPEDGSFRFQQGPIFHNLVLAAKIHVLSLVYSDNYRPFTLLSKYFCEWTACARCDTPVYQPYVVAGLIRSKLFKINPAASHL